MKVSIAIPTGKPVGYAGPNRRVYPSEHSLTRRKKKSLYFVVRRLKPSVPILWKANSNAPTTKAVGSNTLES